jgi:hypothetical protein
MDDASYYTKSKLMFDISDLYESLADDEDDGDQFNFKLNKNAIKVLCD